MIRGDTFNAKTQIRHGVHPRNVLLKAAPHHGVQRVPAGFVADAHVGNHAVRWFAYGAVGGAPGNQIVVEISFTAEIDGHIDPLAVSVLLENRFRGCRARRHHGVFDRDVKVFQLIGRGTDVAVRQRCDTRRHLGHAEASIWVTG